MKDSWVAAVSAGELTYKGQPCRRFNHDGIRYTNNRVCVRCSDLRNGRQPTEEESTQKYPIRPDVARLRLARKQLRRLLNWFRATQPEELQQAILLREPSVIEHFLTRGT